MSIYDAMKVRQDGCRYYISNLNSKYLHCDGQILSRTVNSEGVYTGLYDTEENAQACLDKFKPKPPVYTTDDLKPGDKFICPHYDETSILTCLKYDYLPLAFKWDSARAKPAMVFYKEQTPFELEWFNSKQEVKIVSRKQG